MNSINTNINNKYGSNPHQIRFKAGPQAVAVQQDVQLPDMYYMPDYANRPQSFKEKLKKYDVMGLIYNWFAHPFLMIATCLGISLGVGQAEKSFRKDYAKSSLGKATALGDKLEQSSLVQNKFSQGILGGIKKCWNGTKNFLMKSSVIRAMVETPTKPENQMPKGEMKNSAANIVDRFKSLASKYNLQGKEEEGANLFESVKKPFKKLLKTEEKDFTEILKGLGKSESEIEAILKGGNAKEVVSAELRKAFGFADDALEKIMKDESGETAKMVEEYCQKVKNVPKFNEVYNRLHCIGDGAKTKTGQFFGKMLQKLYRGFTFGNSKYGVMFWVAPFLVNTFINTHKADKKEKIGTFVDGLIQSVSWVFVFPLVLMGIHAIGGIQHAGMSKEKVKMMHEQIEKFNERVFKKEFQTKADYNKARKGLEKRIKALKRVKNQSLLTKILRKISAFTKADLNAIKPYNNGSKLGNFLRKAAHNTKSFAYSAGRVGVFFLVGMPFLDKIIEKCTSAIFGKPYDAMKEEESEENKKAQEEYTMNDLRERMLDIQRRKEVNGVNGLNVNQAANNQLAPETDAAMAELAAAAAAEQAAEQVEKGQQAVQKQPIPQQTQHPQQQPEQQAVPYEQPLPQAVQQTAPQQVQQPQQQILQTQGVVQNPAAKRDNYTYIPSQNSVLNTIEQQVQTNKYIPSQIGAKFDKAFDNSGLDAALKRASNAEKKALSVLSGNFNTKY